MTTSYSLVLAFIRLLSLFCTQDISKTSRRGRRLAMNLEKRSARTWQISPLIFNKANHLLKAACFLSLFAVSDASAAGSSFEPYEIPRIDNAPRIDGQVAPAEWAEAKRVTINIETDPAENVTTAVSAEALIMEDGDTLYVAFIAQDPDISQIRAFYSDRDLLWDDDHIGIVLDTFNDERRAYEFWVNPLGVQADRIYDDINRRGDDSWNAIWDSAGRITLNGYETEMAIPLKQLRFSPSEAAQIWGVDFVRRFPRDRENRIANNPLDRDVSCYLCQLRKMEGLADLESSRNLEIIPSLTALTAQTRGRDLGPWEEPGAEPDAGVNLRWGVTQDVYLNATLNPDFSQVEADSPQLAINNTFSLFFPERRTFFLDGADYFDTFQNLVYTRNIADPDYGLKLTGKSGRHTYGVLTANDQTTGFIVPGALGSSTVRLADPSLIDGAVESDINIGRYRMDLFENSAVGIVVTDRRADQVGYSNSVASLDAVLRPTEADTISVQGVYSRTKNPQQLQERFDSNAQQNGDSLRLEYRHVDAEWDWRLSYDDIGEDFRADLGFVNRTDFKKFIGTLGRTWRADGNSLLSRFRIAIDYDRTEDQSGKEIEEELEFFVNMNGPAQSYLNALVGGSKTFWNGAYFDEQFNQVSVGFSPIPSLGLGATLRIEDIVDFANTRLGQSNRLSPFIRLQIGRHLQFNLSHTHQQFNVDGGRLFTANLSDLRTTYQFNAKSFLRFTLQYNDRKRDRSLYLRDVQSRSADLTAQLLYSYRFTAATRFFVGYSDASFQDDRYDGLEPIGRSLFAKFTYAWQP